MSLRPRVIVKSDGRITIPDDIRKKLGIKKDTVLELQVIKNTILITVLVK